MVYRNDLEDLEELNLALSFKDFKSLKKLIDDALKGKQLLKFEKGYQSNKKNRQLLGIFLRGFENDYIFMF